MNQKITSKTRNVPLNLTLPLSSFSYSTKSLSGLGKATKRGVKKCFKCGIYNGTRSLKCKNKKCGVLFKDSDEKFKIDLEAVKLLTGTIKQVYSVRVRDIGPDYRGFVQLPLIYSQKEDDSKLSEVALCFVDSCQRLFDDSILKCHEEEQHKSNPVCIHVRAAIKSCTMATSIDFRHEILQSLRVPNEIKENLFLLSKEKGGPLVQRVSRTVMAVKCQVTSKHPLGYLHFTFLPNKGTDSYENYFCSCTEFISMYQDKSDNIKCKCIHYYACICALASDTNYLEEFINFVNQEFPTNKVNVTGTKKNYTEELKTGQQTLKRKKVKDIGTKEVLPKTSIVRHPLKKCKTIAPKIYPIEIKLLNTPEEPVNNDNTNQQNNISWTFLDWLTYVTESINKTMKFDNCGILNTLIFHIPECFYSCLIDRLPRIYGESGNNPISYNSAYHIMNILHVKEIFDTAKVKLCISKKFVHSEQNGYMEYDNDDETDDTYKSTFIFFLNVGQSTVDENDNTNNSFFIEWLPNISDVSKVGQLKLQYKYGRKST